MMQCMDCEISDFDFGTPSYTQSIPAAYIDYRLGGILTDFQMGYLSDTDPSFANEFRLMLAGESVIDQGATLFTIEAAINGAYDGNFNSNFGAAIEGLMYNSDADFTNDIIVRLLQTYFEINYAILKQQNPNWSNEKLFYEASKEVIHLSLDAVGLIEGLGTPADLLNAGLYYLEGDRVNGNLSLVAATPVIGLFSTTVKGALRLQGFIPGTTKKITQVWAKDGSLIKFGGTSLRRAMGITDPLNHAHHILPLEHVNHPVVQKAAKLNGNPFHIDEINNGLEVLASQNTTHPAYNNLFFMKLENFNNSYPNATSEQAYNFINQEIAKAKAAIQSLPTNGKINDVTWN
ncbi:hypothetical protein JYB64_20240 [Algoriphagus aestuarii]|nr:hypothetical protein [Algoriphagus aestuarii]